MQSLRLIQTNATSHNNVGPNNVDVGSCWHLCMQTNTTPANIVGVWSLLGSLSNDDGNVNENVEKQWIKLQNTITAPSCRRRLLKQTVKTSVLEFCRESER